MALFGLNLSHKLSLISKTSLFVLFSRNISVSAVNRLKQIKYTEKDNTLTVEAVKIKSERTERLVPKTTHQPKDCCPLCRLNLRRIEYTDILILSQFVESNGELIPQSITGLCNKMHSKVMQLVQKAQRCQLMTRPSSYKVYGPWDQLNTYYEWPERFRDQPMKIIEPKYWKSEYKQNTL